MGLGSMPDDLPVDGNVDRAVDGKEQPPIERLGKVARRAEARKPVLVAGGTAPA